MDFKILTCQFNDAPRFVQPIVPTINAPICNDIGNSQHHKDKGKKHIRKSGRFQPIKEVKKIFYHQLFII